MICPNCKNDMNEYSFVCPVCGFDPNQHPWVVITTVYPPNDIIIASLLSSCGIPVKFMREAMGPIQGLAIGPLAEVKIAVPELLAEEAAELLSDKNNPLTDESDS